MKEIKCTILHCVCKNFCDSILLRLRFCYGKKLRFRFYKLRFRWFRYGKKLLFWFRNTGFKVGSGTGITWKLRFASGKNFQRRSCLLYFFFTFIWVRRGTITRPTPTRQQGRPPPTRPMEEEDTRACPPRPATQPALSPRPQAQPTENLTTVNLRPDLPVA
jgi:hypothetical protein